MNRREIVVILSLATILIFLNLFNYLSRQRLKHSYSLLVVEGRIQISINDADVHELVELPGIGPALANRIIEYRTFHGPFQRLEEIKSVKGIGDKIFQRLLPYIKL